MSRTCLVILISIRINNRLNIFLKLNERVAETRKSLLQHTHTCIHVDTHTLVPVTRESWRIGIFSTHQRGTLKNGTRILFTVSREERASFSIRRGMEVAEWKSKRCQTSVERKHRRGNRISGIEPMEFANDIFLTSRFSFRSNFSSRSTSSTPFLHYIFPTSTETLLSWDFPDAVGRSTNPQSQCLCQTSNCLCCIDLNLTATFDLGGPACINVRQKEQNVSLNLSYGDNPVHNATIKIGKTDSFVSKYVQ